MENIRNHMTGTEKKVKKDKLVKRFKECFDKELSDVLTEEGVKKFYDPSTSVDFAEGMLDRAAVHLAIGETLGSILSSVLGGDFEVMTEEEFKKELEAENEDIGFGDTTEEFQVYNTKGKFFYDNTFSSEVDARCFISEEAHNTEYRAADLKVVRVYD